MSALKHEAFADRLPNELEITNAKQLRTIIAAQMTEGRQTKLDLALKEGGTEPLILAPALAESLLEVLRLVSTGRGFRMIPVEASLTTQEAADCLNVSRPYLIKLLESDQIPFTKTGRHRKILATDLFGYKDKRDAIRSNALSELAELDAENGLI